MSITIITPRLYESSDGFSPDIYLEHTDRKSLGTKTEESTQVSQCQTEEHKRICVHGFPPHTRNFSPKMKIYFNHLLLDHGSILGLLLKLPARTSITILIFFPPLKAKVILKGF